MNADNGRWISGRQYIAWRLGWRMVLLVAVDCAVVATIWLLQSHGRLRLNSAFLVGATTVLAICCATLLLVAAWLMYAHRRFHCR